MIKYKPKKVEIMIAMAKQGLNQTTLSEKADLNKATVSTFLNGKRSISANSARKIAVALDSNLEDLFKIEIQDNQEFIQ